MCLDIQGRRGGVHALGSSNLHECILWRTYPMTLITNKKLLWISIPLYPLHLTVCLKYCTDAFWNVLTCDTKETVCSFITIRSFGVAPLCWGVQETMVWQEPAAEDMICWENAIYNVKCRPYLVGSASSLNSVFGILTTFLIRGMLTILISP